MQSLSQMLSPLKNCGPNSSNQSSGMGEDTGMMNLQPLSIMIPSNEYEDMETQSSETNNYHNAGNQLWQQTYTQEPLLTSKSPEDDKLTSLNMQLGNQYTYQMQNVEPGTFGYYNQLCSTDPRTNYDNFSYAPAEIQPFKDTYYKCAYEQPKTERTAIRHKMEDEEDIGPVAKRHCGESSSGNGQRVIVQETASMGSVSSTNEGRRI